MEQREDRGSSRCQGPEIGTSWPFLRNRRKRGAPGTLSEVEWGGGVLEVTVRRCYSRLVSRLVHKMPFILS